MQQQALIASAATPTIAVLRNIKPDQLDAPTPCGEYSVRKLIDHLLYWGPALERAARKEPAEPPTASGSETDRTDGDRASELEAQTNRLVAAWSEPGAWEGTTRMGGPTPLPAPMIGAMVLGELIVHGWDLARATGQGPTWDDELLRFVHRELEKTAEQGRAMGVYGAPVTVPDTAPVLDRILGLTGRDPNWTV